MSFGVGVLVVLILVLFFDIDLFNAIIIALIIAGLMTCMGG